MICRRAITVIFAVGAQTDKALGIPGEDLPGSHAATDFVGWYNGHPDYRHLSFDLSQQAVAVVGVGNVAMDVARILASSPQELARTDIADHALAALANSQVTDIYLLGRRGAAQAAFTNPEIKELGELEDAEVLVRPEDVQIDDLTRQWLASPFAEPKNAKNVDTLTAYAQQPPAGKRRRIHVRFLVSPVEVLGDQRVTGLRLVHNKLAATPDGDLKAQATDQTEILPVGLVFRSVGYTGVPLPDVPFDKRKGVIPNAAGRVLQDDVVQCGLYAVGWIKRGASGIIGTNKPDSYETAKNLLEDVQHGAVWNPTEGIDDVPQWLASKGVRVTTFADWQRLDSLEVAQGAQQGRPRVKFTTIEQMLDALSAGS